jgi:FMN-dependent oxidoreductase (nitrilotriacetate monooxygenase family)
MSKPTKQIHLAAHFPGVNNTTVWSDPAAGSHIEFDSFRRFAQTAERGKFDFLFLAEGLRLREQNGLIYDLDVVGRPDTFTILAALAAVTDKLGLTGTINSTFNEPYEVARQFASLDHLSGGRAAWNVVTSWDAFTGENFRRGGFLAQNDRYARARTFLEATWELFDSWTGDEILADKDTGQFLTDRRPGRFEHHDNYFDIAGQFNVPRSPQGRPVVFQAGDSEDGREFAAASADAIFSRHSTLVEGQTFYADVKGRLAKYGRTRDQLLILPAATFVLGDTEAEASDLAHEVRLAQVSPATAIKFLEQLWNTDLSDFDVDGPLPSFDPVVSENLIAKGRASARMFAKDPLALANEWRAKAEAEHLTTREVIIEVTGRQSFVGTPSSVAESINELVQADASDGIILVPHITPAGLEPFVDQVVPLLQEWGVFRSDYHGSTLRDHLGLRELASLDSSSAGRAVTQVAS